MKEKQKEILELTSDLQRAKFKHENMDNQITKLSQDINEYLFALRRYDQNANYVQQWIS